MNGQQLQPEQKARFIELLRDTGNPSVSARAIGFSPATLKRHRERDEDFDREWTEAIDEANDALEAEARRRATRGDIRTKAIKVGKDDYEVIEEVQFSDALLIRLLEANKPEKFANRSKTEITNPDGNLAPMLGSTEIAARLASILAMAEARMQKENG